MGIAAGKIDLNFDASEWFALQELARKHRTDVGSILRIGGVMLLEADRRGQFKIRAAPPIDVNSTRKADA